MSYGLIVGYGRSLEFVNALYGLAMLGVVGGLYGFLGGGLFGLGLSGRSQAKTSWASLISEMVAGAILVYWIVILQLGWKMTPPRSELWAACLGAALALGWFLYRESHIAALRTAAFSALGAGFGFSLGNFLQTVGTATGLMFNWWNVMEFTLGLCGGLGMLYGVLSQQWAQLPPPGKGSNWSATAFLILILPLVNIFQAFETERLQRLAETLEISDVERLIQMQWVLAAVLLLLLTVVGLVLFRRSRLKLKLAPSFFLYLVAFVLLSNIRKGVPAVGVSGQPEQFLYWLAVLLLLGLWWAWGRRGAGSGLFHLHPAATSFWTLAVIVFLLVAALMAYTSIHIHGELSGAQSRF